MTAEMNDTSIFISYAWGEGFEKKEWVRRSIVANLDWKYQVFWDRDTIALGELVSGTIGKALAKRPLMVLCLCDEDYLEAASREGQGLCDELAMLAAIADQPDVRIVPLVLEANCSNRMPSPLAGRLYLNLQPLHNLGLDIGTTVLGVAEGLSQAQLQKGINESVALHHLRQRALAFLNQRPLTIWGNGKTHEVTVRPHGAGSYTLTPPAWMWESVEWRIYLEDDVETSCPTQGRWHWEYIAVSSETRPLATAVMSTFFPQSTSQLEQRLLDRAGTLLAHRFFRMIYSHEAFSFNVDDLVSHLTQDEESCDLLRRILDAAGATTTAA